MKKYQLLVFLMAITIGLSANIDPNTAKSSCRMDSADLNLCENVQERIKSDLLDGSWSEHIDDTAVANKEVERTFNFQKIGMVEIITRFQDGSTEMSRQIWRVEEVNNQAFLILTNIGSDRATSYEIKQTCEGMILKDKVLEKQMNWVINT